MLQAKSSTTTAAFALMDEVQPIIFSGEVPRGMTKLILGLDNIRRSSSPQGWQQLCQLDFLEHSLTSIIHQDPFTRHCFEKARGYAGDAGLLDKIYGLYDMPNNITPLGKHIFYYNTQAPAPVSVRARRKILAEIDQVAIEKPFGIAPGVAIRTGWRCPMNWTLRRG